jgi:hypothetical protein
MVKEYLNLIPSERNGNLSVPLHQASKIRGSMEAPLSPMYYNGQQIPLQISAIETTPKAATEIPMICLLR